MKNKKKIKTRKTPTKKTRKKKNKIKHLYREEKQLRTKPQHSFPGKSSLEGENPKENGEEKTVTVRNGRDLREEKQKGRESEGWKVHPRR